jgi:hypothetical protein
MGEHEMTATRLADLYAVSFGHRLQRIDTPIQWTGSRQNDTADGIRTQWVAVKPNAAHQRRGKVSAACACYAARTPYTVNALHFSSLRCPMNLVE